MVALNDSIRRGSKRIPHPFFERIFLLLVILEGVKEESFKSEQEARRIKF